MSANGGSVSTQGLSDEALNALGKIGLGGNNRARMLTPYMVGLWLDAVLIGIVIVLFSRWLFDNRPTEKWLVQVLVYSLVVLHCGTSVYNVADQMHVFVAGWANYARFLKVDWARAPIILNAISRIASATFFTHRAWFMYNKSIFVPLLLVPLMMGYAACSFSLAALWSYVPTPPLAKHLFIGLDSLAIAIDGSIMILLGVGVYQRRTGWSKTDRLLTRVLRMTIETQVPPTIAASMLLMTVVVWADAPYIVYFTGNPKIHLICLLAVLLSRVDLAKQLEGSAPGTYVYSLEQTTQAGNRANNAGHPFSGRGTIYNPTDLSGVPLTKTAGEAEASNDELLRERQAPFPYRGVFEV